MYRRLSEVFVVTLVLSALWLCPVQAATQEPGGSPYPLDTKRSATIGHRGMVATSQPLAALAGLDILKKGGNAIDAAVATAAVLTVMEPHSTALGGDMFAMVYLASEDKLVGLNASGRSAYGMTIEAVKARLEAQHLNRLSGIYSVTVPGAVDGWFKILETYGTMSMPEVLEQAIYYAEHGFHVSERIAQSWSSSQRKLARERRTPGSSTARRRRSETSSSTRTSPAH